MNEVKQYKKQYKQMLKEHPQAHYVRFKPFTLSSMPKLWLNNPDYPHIKSSKDIRVPFFIWYMFYKIMLWQDKRSNNE